MFYRDDQIKARAVEPALRASQESQLWRPADPSLASLPAFDTQKLKIWKESMKSTKIRDQLTRLLGKTLIFAQTSEAFRAALTNAVLPVEFYPGQVVYRHGQPGTWLGIVLSGRLERKLERQHKEIHTGDIGPGGIIGDLGLFGITAIRSFSVISLTQSVILILSQEKFAEAIDEGGMPGSLSIFRDGSQMQNLMADTESFVNLQCFQRLDRDFVMTLRENSEPRLCYPNQILMKEGHFGDEMYILRAGTVKIEKHGKCIVEVPAGVVLGELAVLGADKRRTATVICSSLCLIRALHADVFHEILDKFPAAKRVFDHAYIARLVSVEVHNTRDEMQHLDRFYGSAVPRNTDEMQKLFGASVKKLDDTPRTSENLKTVALPALTPRSPSGPRR